MLKKRIRKWLGISVIDYRVLGIEGRFAGQDLVNSQVADAYDRVRNMYESNRTRIDQVREHHIQTREVMLARIIALEALNTALLKTKQKKPTTPKKGK